MRQDNTHREELRRAMQYNGQKGKIKRVVKVGWSVVLLLGRPQNTTLRPDLKEFRGDGPCGGVG